MKIVKLLCTVPQTRTIIVYQPKVITFLPKTFSKKMKLTPIYTEIKAIQLKKVPVKAINNLYCSSLNFNSVE